MKEIVLSTFALYPQKDSRILVDGRVQGKNNKNKDPLTMAVERGPLGCRCFYKEWQQKKEATQTHNYGLASFSV